MRRSIVGKGIFLFTTFISVNLFCQPFTDTLSMLTPYQVRSLQEYLEAYGDVLSLSELANVDGFTADDAAWLWDDALQYMNGDRTSPRQEISTRFKKKYSGDGFSLTGKYFYDSGGKFAAGALLDQDPGDKFPGFVSGHVKYRNFIAGDYSARFGQGLVLWKAFSYSAMGEPSVLMKRGSGLQPYKSSDEDNHLRGAAASFNIADKVKVSVFGSYDKVSKTARDSGTVHEFLCGTNATWTGKRFKIGITAVGYSYDRPVKVTVKDYNRLRQYNGLWGNFGLDFLASFGSLRVFGEVGLDAKASPAALAGVLWSPSYAFEASFQARAYSPSYTAAHSMSSTYNDLGASASVKYLWRRWKFNLNAEYDYYPWYRYNKPAGGSSYKVRVAAQYTSAGGIQGLAQITCGETFKMRLHCSVPVGNFRIALRAESNIVSFSDMGHAFYAEVSYVRQKITVSARGTWYDTDSWNSRIYLYEKNVPQSFGSEVYYKTGAGWYVVAKYEPRSNIDLYLKMQQNYCAFFMRIFIPG